MSYPLCMKMTIVFGSLPSRNWWHWSLVTRMRPPFNCNYGNRSTCYIRQLAAESKQLINEKRQESEKTGSD